MRDGDGTDGVADKALARDLIRIRIAQLLVNEAYKAGKFLIPIHLALGHESIAVAVAAGMKAEDLILLSHRNIHYNLALTQALKPVLDEYLLKEAGLGGGRMGSMNLDNEAARVIYTSSILGNNLAVAAGVALAQKVRMTGVTFVVTGDGAMEEGSLHETLIFMMSNRLASVIVVENNGWSLATRIPERRCEVDLRKLAEAVGARYEKLSGNNVLEYAEKIRDLRCHAETESAPVCLEVMVETLGSWVVKSEACPEGRYINYHYGPARTVSLEDWPAVADGDEDPLNGLKSYCDEDWLARTAMELRATLEAEIR